MKSKQKETKLKRCPFCGGIPRLNVYITESIISCSWCGARTLVVSNGTNKETELAAKQSVVKAWNRRVTKTKEKKA